MAAREHTTPLILWICAAVCAHFMFAEGGDVVATVHDDHTFIRHMGSEIREKVRSDEQTFDIQMVADNASPEAPPEPPKPPPPEKKPDPKKDAVVEIKKPDPIPPPPPKKEEKREVKIAVVPKDPAKALELPPVPLKDKRIAVKQHVKPDQEDNKDARFIGDEANHVKEESVATVTSHDQDDPLPTPGGSHAGPQSTPGDSSRTKIADSEEHKGEQNRRPGEKGTEFEVQRDPMPERPMGPVAVKAQASQEPPRGGGDGRAPQVAPPQTEPALAPGGSAPAAPEIAQGADGANWSFNPVRPGAGLGTAQDSGQGQAARSAARPSPMNFLGLGGTPGPGQINLNLTNAGVVAVVGQDQLRKEREADGERRKSEHRGSFQASNFERWRNAIENYVSSVKPGNQTALNTAKSPFGTYLVMIHNRIHPIFADSFLDSLDSLPHEHPLNNQRLVTKLEIVLTKEGRIIKMGVVKPSGVTAFDVAALDSVQRASPFGPAPSAIFSGDGNVYLHWEFHRERGVACSTINSYPYILNNAPPSAPPGTLPNQTPPNHQEPAPTHEHGAPPPANINETREGLREMPLSEHTRS